MQCSISDAPLDKDIALIPIIQALVKLAPVFYGGTKRAGACDRSAIPKLVSRCFKERRFIIALHVDPLSQSH